MAKLKLTHLSEEEHQRLGVLLTRVTADIKDAARIVKRAPFTDATLQSMLVIQTLLINPLREARYDENPGERKRELIARTEKDDSSLYPAVWYTVSWPRKRY